MLRERALTAIIRTLTFLRDFCICAANLGVRSAWVILIATRYGRRPRTVRMKRFNRNFTFRGNADKGVMSHFYKPGYRIVDTVDRPVRTIIDCGANIGDETVRFLHFHPEARIVAIEAEAANFDILTENLSGVRSVNLRRVCGPPGLDFGFAPRLPMRASR